MPHADPNRLPPELKIEKSDVKIGGPIGRGVSGSVYQGRLLSLDKDIAIKVIRSLQPGADGNDVKHEALKSRKMLDYKSEIATLAMLQHPNIVELLGYCEGDREDETYILLELAAKGNIASMSLVDLRATKPVAHMLQVLDWCLQVAKGLKYIHSMDVIHLDLKPRNILLFGDNIVKICDFGTSKLLDGNNEDTTTPKDFTARYVSPESATGEKVSRESDLYSFGCVMLELITGLPPWHHLHPTSALAALCEGQVPNLDDYVWPLPCTQEVQALVGRLMMYNPDDRAIIVEAIEVLENAIDAARLQLPVQMSSQPLDFNWLEGVADCTSLEVAVALLVGYRAPSDRPDTNFCAESIRNVIPELSSTFLTASADEKALFMYTAQSPVSKIINAALSENNKNSVNLPYVSPICKRLYRAIQSHGTAYSGPAFRVLYACTPALKHAFENFKVTYAQGTSIEFTQFSSFTKDLSRIESFTTATVGDESAPLIVFTCENITAFDISDYSAFSESEVIALPPSYFTVSSSPYKVQQAVHVQLTFLADRSHAATYLKSQRELEMLTYANIADVKANIAVSIALNRTNNHYFLQKQVLRLITQATAEIAKVADPSRMPQGVDPGDSELHTAAQSGSVADINSQLALGADHSARNNAGATPLFKAAQKGNAAAIRTLSRRGASADTPTSSGVTPLQAAVLGDHAAAIHALVALGVAVHDANFTTNTIVSAIQFRKLSALNALLLYVNSNDPLIIKVHSHVNYGVPLIVVSAALGNVKAIEALINCGADVNKCDSVGVTAMHAAALNNDVKVFDALVSFGADIDARDPIGATAMHAAATLGHVHFVNAAIKARLKHGLSVDPKDSIKSTPLFIAAFCGHLEVVESLINSHADVFAATGDGSTALHAAAHENHIAVVKALSKHRCNADPKNNNGSTPLHVAASRGNVEIIEILIDCGADATAFGERGLTALHLAAQANHVKVVMALLKKGCNVDPKDNRGSTPLLLAAQCGRINVVEALICSGADVTITNEHNFTALHAAAQENHTPVINTLVEHGCKVDANSADGSTPLFLAALRGHVEAVEVLISFGADVDAVRKDGFAVLHAATEQKRAAVVSALLKKRCNVDPKSDDGSTPLIRAASLGCVEVVEALISSGADVGVAREDGLTALHAAAQENHAPVVKTLLKHGCNIDAKNNGGLTPLFLAASLGCVEVVEALISSGAEVDAALEDG
ncbi:ankyrin repeat protein, putative, partial [Bodo saltans]